MRVTTPCTGCDAMIEVDCFNKEDASDMFVRAGAVWDRGWFHSQECADIFNKDHPNADGWDRAKRRILRFK